MLLFLVLQETVESNVKYSNIVPLTISSQYFCFKTVRILYNYFVNPETAFPSQVLYNEYLWFMFHTSKESKGERKIAYIYKAELELILRLVGILF